MYKRCQKLGYDFFYADHAYFYNEKFKKMSCFRVTKNNHANTKSSIAILIGMKNLNLKS